MVFWIIFSEECNSPRVLNEAGPLADFLDKALEAADVTANPVAAYRAWKEHGLYIADPK